MSNPRYEKVIIRRGNIEKHTCFAIPAEVLADRDRRYSAMPRDLTGALQGDPPLGYSALDQGAPCKS